MMGVPRLPLSLAREAGPFVFISGQLALRDGQVVGDTVSAHTDLVIDAIEGQLARFALDLSDVVKTTVWLTSASDFPAFNAAYAKRFRDPYPARATVVSALLLPGALVEIEAIAFRPDERGSPSCTDLEPGRS